jgi:hypothetical protein
MKMEFRDVPLWLRFIHRTGVGRGHRRLH